MNRLGAEFRLDNAFWKESAATYETKQLANVLIKILGLSICVHGFPAFVAAMIGAVETLVHAMRDGHPTNVPLPYWTYSLTYLIQSTIEFIVGIFIIVRSRWLVEKLFKDEEE